MPKDDEVVKRAQAYNSSRLGLSRDLGVINKALILMVAYSYF